MSVIFCDMCSKNSVSKHWDTCLCGNRICFPCVQRRVVQPDGICDIKGRTFFPEKTIEIRCSDSCELPKMGE